MPRPASGYPVAHVEFDGQAVPPDAVRLLELETNVGFLADALTLVLDNAALYSDFIRKEQPVEAWMGYVGDPHLWDTSELVHVFSGAVDGVLPTFGDDRTLAIKARDHTRLLIDSQADPGWAYANLDDAGIVRLLCELAGLHADVAAAAAPISEEEQQAFLGGGYPGDPQVGMSGWDIVQTLAVRNGFVAFVTPDKVLHWGPRGSGWRPVPGLFGVQVPEVAASVGTWTYLAEPFDVLAADFDDSALVVNKVTVARWVGVDDSNPQGYVSGSHIDAGRLKAARGRVIEKSVISRTANGVPECEAEAAAILAGITAAAITATVTLEGSPLLLGDVKLTLAGAALGRFAADYWLESCTHRLSADGYDCEARLSSVRPEASELYREGLAVLDPDEVTALRPDAPTPNGAAPTVAAPCGDPPLDYAGEWPEFGGPVARLLVDNGISVAIGTEDATCGPIAAAGMLKAFGIATDPGKLAARAYKGGGPIDRWWSGGGMAGPASEVKLLESQGLQARDIGRDLTEAVRRGLACQPVIFDTAGGASVGHYILASAYRASDSRFFGGVTIANAMRASHGNPWATVAEIESYGLGRIRSVIVADAPAPTRTTVGFTVGAGVAGASDPTGLPPIQSTGNGDSRRMVENLKPLAYAWEKAAGIPANVILAINASESNWGNTPGNMLFGVVCTGEWPCQSLKTSAGYLDFNAYPTANHAYKDWIGRVTTGRYATAYARLKAGGSGEQFVADLQSAGYAGDHNAEDRAWTQTIVSLMRTVDGLL